MTIWNAKNIRKLKTLSEYDLVNWPGDTISRVCSDHMTSDSGFNSRPITEAGVAFDDRHVVASACYGYGTETGDWPCAQEGDRQALTRLVKEIFHLRSLQPKARKARIASLVAKGRKFKTPTELHRIKVEKRMCKLPPNVRAVVKVFSRQVGFRLPAQARAGHRLGAHGDRHRQGDRRGRQMTKPKRPLSRPRKPWRWVVLWNKEWYSTALTKREARRLAAQPWFPGEATIHPIYLGPAVRSRP